MENNGKNDMTEPSTIADIKHLTCYEIFLVGSLCYINVINYMDRVGIASILVKIQDHFEIGDEYGGLLQTSLLTALTFSAPFFGYFGDRFSRKWFTIGCMLLWSASTVGGALAKNYWILLCSRILVGVGQSGFTTISPTVLSDIALRGARTVLLSCFYLGIPIGGGLGYVTCSAATELTGSWRFGLCVGPVLCLIGVGLLSFAHFPKRGEKEVRPEVSSKRASTYKEDLLYLIRVPSFLTTTAAFTCVCFCVGAMSWWMPKCLYFGFNLLPDGSSDIETSSFIFGAITVFTGILSVLLGLTLSRLLRERFPRIDPIICGLGLLFTAPFVAGALTLIAKSKLLTYVCIFFGMLQINLNWAIITDTLLRIVIPSRRTSAQGIHLLFAHALGDCSSPYLVGHMSEYLKNNYQFTNGSFFIPYKRQKPDDVHSVAQHFHSLQWSLFFLVFFFILGAIFFFVTARFIVKDAEKAKN